MNKADVYELSKAQLIQELNKLVKPSWKAQLSRRAGVTLNAVLRWVDGTTRHSYRIEEAARQMIYEEYEIYRLFPKRAVAKQ